MIQAFHHIRTRDISEFIGFHFIVKMANKKNEGMDKVLINKNINFIIPILTLVITMYVTYNTYNTISFQKHVNI